MSSHQIVRPAPSTHALIISRHSPLCAFTTCRTARQRRPPRMRGPNGATHLDAALAQERLPADERRVLPEHDARDPVQHARRRAHDARRQPGARPASALRRAPCSSMNETRRAHARRVHRALAQPAHAALRRVRPAEPLDAVPARARRMSHDDHLPKRKGAHISACSVFEFFCTRQLCPALSTSPERCTSAALLAPCVGPASHPFLREGRYDGESPGNAWKGDGRGESVNQTASGARFTRSGSRPRPRTCAPARARGGGAAGLARA